jgi:hypothetical protein
LRHVRTILLGIAALVITQLINVDRHDADENE